MTTEQTEQRIQWFFSEISDSAVNPNDKVSPTLTYATEYLAPLLKFSPEELLPSLRADLASKANQHMISRAMRARAQKLYAPYVLKVTHTSGELVGLEVTPRPLYDARGECQGTTATLRLQKTRTHDRYRLAVEAGGVGVWEWDLASGRAYLDPGLKSMLGYEDHEISDDINSWYELIHSLDKTRLERKMALHLGGHSSIFEDEHRMLHKNGSEIWVLARGIAVRDKEGNPVRMSGTNLEITARKHAEEAVEKERERLFNLLDRMPAFVCLIAPDHSVPFANRYYREEFGENMDAPCFVRKHKRNSPCTLCPPFETFSTQSLSIWEQFFSSTQKTYQMYSYPFQDPDGSPLVLLLGMDITQIKNTQTALSASEERYRSISDNLALGIVVVDRALRVRSENPKMREWFPHLDFTKTLFCYTIFGFTEQCGNCPIRQSFSDGLVHEISFRAKPGPGLEPPKDFRVLYCPMFNADGIVSSVIAIVEDVTEQLLVQARLAQAQRVESLGTLAGGIAHEINQPLNALQLYASGMDMLLEQNRQIDHETLHTRLGLILKETDKIHDIITHMRTLVHEGEKNVQQNVNLNDIVRSGLTLLQAQLVAHGISLHLQLQEDIPGVRANKVQLEQIVVNLTVNAMQALDTLDSTTRPEKNIEISTQSHAQDGAVVLSVCDNGIGLQGVEDKMFDPFFTSKEPGKGMGVGLAICHTFINGWGGEISARTNELGGATFTVRLLT